MFAIWVQLRGEDAASGPPLRPRKFAITEEDRRWWAFQPVRRPAPPRVSSPGAVLHPIDRFIVSRLELEGLAGSAPASRRELIRRATFDLLGLPPSPEEVAGFERDRAPDAWERLIDRLLARPEYGERWARHWLDLVRFAESNGYERDGAKPHAWRFRDYVIRSFDEDKPYDRFILEQLAGDELEFDEQAIIATGFYRLHVWDDEPDSTLAAEFDDLDDIMVTTGAAFLGMTLGCARCHDHKFDPISQPDYYRTLAYFRSINPYGLHKTGGGGRGTGRITRPLARIEDLQAWESAKAEQTKPIREAIAATTDEAQRKKLRAEIQKIEENPPFPFALAVHEDPVKPTHLFRRGEVLSPAEELQPGVPAVLAFAEPVIERGPRPTSSGRRLAFARWLAHPANPLTARVFVNRLWKHHFGHGLVATPNDFGRTGSPPTHPELLDFLAADFMEGGWSIKRMHKRIMTSEAYRQGSRNRPGTAKNKDEANLLLWRQNPRRAEAEVLRDSMLAISGELNLTKGGPGFFPSLPKDVHRTQDSEGKGWQQSSDREQAKRSVYGFVKRAMLPPLLECFDYTTTTVPVGDRVVTTVAPQALTLLNDDFVQQQADRLARRLEREARAGDAARIQRAFQLALQREPSSEESLSASFLLQQQSELAARRGANDPAHAALRSLCVAMFNLNEFLYVD